MSVRTSVLLNWREEATSLQEGVREGMTVSPMGRALEASMEAGENDSHQSTSVRCLFSHR